MNAKLITEVVDELYQDVIGYSISFEGRKKLGYHDSAYTYGEILPNKFIEMLEVARPKKDDVFYDLGAGTGKAVVTAALTFELQKSVGIEHLSDLYEASQTIVSRLESILDRKAQELKDHAPIEFVKADILVRPLTDATIVFIHATCFHEGMIQVLSRRLESLKKGARVIMVSKQLHSPLFTQIASRDYVFSWGDATVYTYLKNE